MKKLKESHRSTYGQFGYASCNIAYNQNVFPNRTTFLSKPFFIGIHKSDYTSVFFFFNISYRYKNSFISLKFQKK